MPQEQTLKEKELIREQLLKDELITPEELQQAEEQELKSGIPFWRNLIISRKILPKVVEDIIRYANYEFHPFVRKEETKLGELLVSMGAINRSQLKVALDEQKKTDRLLGRILQDHGYTTKETIAQALAKLHNWRFVVLADLSIDFDLLDLIPADLAMKHKVIPFELSNSVLKVAFVNPRDAAAYHDLQIVSGHTIEPCMAAEDDVELALERYYAKRTAMLHGTSKQVQTTGEAPRATERTNLMSVGQPEKHEVPKRKFDELRQLASNMPVVKLVATIIEGAIRARATDIHLDPQEPEMRVRYRIDGTLHDVMTIPNKIEPAIISRLKILADMDITETRRPQDGHINIKVLDHDFDLRVASLPTYLGEKVVLRLLDPASLLTGMKDLGMEPEDLDLFYSMISQPYGMLLVTGPTGSGKTTTLYAALNQMDILSDNIVTIEDPVEYQLSGINQVEVHPDFGVTFATTLRAVLRQDPDIILLGEIRDVESAQISMRAAMTGHLVLSTLHTNNSAEAITTLLNMGINPFVIASSVLGVLAQRLMRKICPHCIEGYKPEPELLQALDLPASVKELHRGAGCDNCYHTGYLGRTGVFEMLRVDDKIKRAIVAGSTAPQIMKSSKLRTLADHARQKILAGVTTAEDFYRVIGVE